MLVNHLSIGEKETRKFSTYLNLNFFFFHFANNKLEQTPQRQAHLMKSNLFTTSNNTRINKENKPRLQIATSNKKQTEGLDFAM